MEVEAEDIPWMDFTAGVGDTWTIFDFTEQYGGGSSSITGTGKYLGTESVTVPAGTFNNCRKFQLTDQETYTLSGSVQYSEFDTETFWFAKDVGLVKIFDVEHEDGTLVETNTSVLKSYEKDLDAPVGGG